MDDKQPNPFSDTRAADYSDAQINDYWVDLADDGDGFTQLVKPTSEMPMLIIGGKGSGKTHIMRYLSSALQRIRHPNGFLQGVRDDGYLGIYMRCSGLNSHRFEGKGQPQDIWQTVFAYYMELWLSQVMISTLRDTTEGIALEAEEQEIVSRVLALFDLHENDLPHDLPGLSAYLRRLQKDADIAINNCRYDSPLNITIRVTSGNLIFGIPAAVTEVYESLRASVFVYLIDEFENLTADQQKFINTLIREKRAPCSFKIGARLYGVRTHATYCAGEDNKEGSEYEKLALDVRLRDNDKRYTKFAYRLICKRLVSQGIWAEAPVSEEELQLRLRSAFESVDTDGLADDATAFVLTKYKNKERPYFETLAKVLKTGLRSNAAPGLNGDADIPILIDKLRWDRQPLLEKLNCLTFYQLWNANKNLKEAAVAIQYDCANYLTASHNGNAYHDRLLHFKYDLLAQLRRECDQKQLYVGFDTLVELSWGNPRLLLVLLRQIIPWSIFKGEQPFGEHPISVSAQVNGVKEASDGFYSEARIVGPDGQHLQNAIGRLGELFRTIRYSHKPSECSPCAFSYDAATTSDEANRLITLAGHRSLLVSIEKGQRDRNSQRIDVKLQLHRMLSPRWDISYNRRGVVVLSTDEVNSIFDPTYTDSFAALLSKREDRMTAPFFGSSSSKRDSGDAGQSMLPGMDNV